MGMLSNIFSKIFPSSHPANTTPNAPPAPPDTPTAAAPAAPVPMPVVDVEQMLDGMAAKAAEKLHWKTSIVDLLKLLGIDSSLAARKTLAQELNYAGPLDGSAEMNIWLHRQVMAQLAANGGKLPADLIH